MSMAQVETVSSQPSAEELSIASPHGLVRAWVAGTFAGLAAATAEVALFFAPGRAPVPPELARTALLCAAIYCGAGLLLGTMLWLAYLLMLRLSTVARRRTVLSASDRKLIATRTGITLAFLAGLALTLDSLFEISGQIPKPLRRLALRGIGTAGVVAASFVLHAFVLRYEAEIGALLVRARWLLVTGASVATLSLAGTAWRAPFDLIPYWALIAAALATPLTFMPLMRGRWFRLPAHLIVLAGLSLTAAGFLWGPTHQTLYTISSAGLVPAIAMREVASLRDPMQSATLEAMLNKLTLTPSASASRSPRDSQPAVLENVPPQDIILVTVDTLRADRVLGPRGAEVMPNLHTFASTATSYPHTFSAASATIHSLMQFMTGTRMHELGWFGPRGDTPTADTTTPTLALQLRQAGYWSESFAGGRLFTTAPGLAIGFDRVHELARGTSRPILARDAVDMLVTAFEQAPAPSFLWAHIMDVHDYYLGKGQLQPLYDQRAHEVDAELGRLFRQLSSSERGRNAVIIVTSDHGEGLAEGRVIAHGRQHPLILTVPLVIRFPGRNPGVVQETISHLDIAPTVLAAAGLQPKGLLGRNLAELADDGARLQSHAFFEQAHRLRVTELGVAAYPWLYWFDARMRMPVMLDLEHDQLGQRNLAGQGLQQEALMRELLVESLANDSGKAGARYSQW